MDLPVSSGNKEGLRARIEGVERNEAADEGLGVTRGMESESDVECIQSPTWRAVRGRRADARAFPFHSNLSLDTVTPSFTIEPGRGRLCDKLPQDTRGHSASLCYQLKMRQSPAIPFPVPSSAEQKTTRHCTVISSCHL
jgi:hypothetical protein